MINVVLLQLILCLLVIYVILKNVKTIFKTNLEPKNVYKVNFFMCDHVIILLTLIIRPIEFSCPFFWCLEIFCWLSCGLDIALQQLDRFLAVYWNLLYHDRVTTRAHTIDNHHGLNSRY